MKAGGRVSITADSQGRWTGEGHPYFRESGKVRIRTEGPAVILAVDNGDITGNEPYREDHIHMHRGCASVLIVLTGEPGRVSVWADSDGMRSGQITLCRVDKMGCIKRIMEEQNGTIFLCNRRQLTLYWELPEDSGVYEGYRILVDGREAGITNRTHYELTGLEAEREL